ncbi:MAG: DUF4080 domain-containing protein [Treponema sp.]|nr:DUF4080 domain-containing protein [Treponema sp.]
MRLLLVGINASYSHTNIGIRSICEFVKEKAGLGVNQGNGTSGNKEKIDESLGGNDDIDFVEFTINQPLVEIFRGILEKAPQMVLFSTYIWNAEIMAKVIPEICKILPGAVVGAGGPEFGYAAEVYLNKISSLDFVMKGEGEETVLELFNEFSTNGGKFGKDSFEKSEITKILESIKGLYFWNREENSKRIVYTGDRPLLQNLSDLPFPYPELRNTVVDSHDCKIFYYESSRGCPYDCSYCMSSLDKRVRFVDLERVFEDLQIFLDAQVPLVKFVDRTYNLKTQRYISIWQYILEHHNHKTMFHFEIEAEYLSPDALDFLQKVPQGVMQFEIGVQSANKKTLAAVNRSTNVEKAAENIKRIPRTIHQHLDLIAGLPYENLESFGNSFDFVMSLKPHALQLGFLKVLHGTQMENFATKNNWQWMENPVYETFSTPYMTYPDILFLKDVEILVDAYWNSGKFVHVMNFLGRKIGFWKFFSELADYARTKGVFDAARRETFWFEFLALNYETFFSNPNFALNEKEIFLKVLYELLRYDFLLRGKQGGFPSWFIRNYDKDRHYECLLAADALGPGARVAFARSEYEVFACNVDSSIPENETHTYEKLILY